MKDGTATGGAELLPGLVVQLPPQLGGVVLRVLAKPLKLGGACPPLKEFAFDHWALQKVTDPVAPRSPTTKEPRLRKAKTSVVALAEEGR
jgi:hypothetical protein